jgi:5-methylcytosine-specific restriction protein A
VLRQIQLKLQKKICEDVDLIDAHSFCWMIRNYYEKGKTEKENELIRSEYPESPAAFHTLPLQSIDTINEQYEKEEEEALHRSIEELEKKAAQSPENPVQKVVTTSVYSRNPNVGALAKLKAEGICQLCNNPAPFTGKNKMPYLEAHHIVWLSEGGTDIIENTVALCPNCHKKMHILNLESDVKFLQKGKK